MKKRNSLAGVSRVCAFTLKQTCMNKSWLISTILLTVFLLGGIPLILHLIATTTISDEPLDQPIRNVIICDETEGAADYNVFKEMGSYQDVTYTTANSMATAQTMLSEADADATLLLNIRKVDQQYALTVYLPKDTNLSRAEAHTFGAYAEECFPFILMQKANLTANDIALLSVPISTEIQQLSLENSDAEDGNIVSEVIEMLVPYLILMLLYFMILFYGQSVANSVLLEKTSKLMDTMLISVNPLAMIFGKLFGVALAAFLQILIWMASAVAGCLLGLMNALKIVPETGDTVIHTLDTIIDNREIFSLSGIILTLLCFALGFLLYCSISAISGSLASKAEDLGKTNYIFVLVLLFSFFMCIGSPSSGDSFLSEAMWLTYFPFTAILVLPSKLLLGQLSATQILIAFSLIIATACFMIWLSATIYRLLVLYRGNPPSMKTLLNMIRTKRSEPLEEKQNPSQE